MISVSLIVINFLLLTVFNRQTFPRILFVLLIFYLSIFYVDLADYFGYWQMYDAPNGNVDGRYFLDRTELGFQLLVYLGNFLGISFVAFKATIYLLCGLILVAGLTKISKRSVNLVLSLYLIYPLLLDLVQIKHFIASSLFIYSFSLFIDSMNKCRISIINFIYFIPSILFHYAFLFLSIMIVVAYLLDLKLFKQDFYPKNSLLLLLLFGATFIVSIFFKNTTGAYLDTVTSIYSYVLYGCAIFIIYILFYLISRKFKLTNEIVKIKQRSIYRFTFLYLTLISGFTFPLLYYHVEFFRFFRVTLLLITSLMLSFFIEMRGFKKALNISIIFGYYILISFAIFSFYYSEYVLMPLIFTDNL